jgi:glucuronoarabinoxylan endo-1,4-beta-xylanase
MEMQRSYQKANRFFQVVPIIAALVICLFFTQAAPAATVNIDLNTTHQTIRGFGGMNFPRWGHGLQTDAQVDTAFGNGPGQIGLTIMRIDVPPDNNYNYAYGDYNWNLAVDAAERAINNHGAIVFASPWSPPPSMKTPPSTIGGQLSTGSYGAFANYLSNFANHYSSNGAPLYAISVQNEPDYLPSYESCGYSATQMQTFLNNNASVIPTRMIAPETTGFNSSYMNTVASSAECNIVAIHIYGGGGSYSYPGKEYWMTEHYTESAHDGNDWPLALDVGKEIHDCMANNMNAYVWWYIRRYYGPMGESGNITKRGHCMSHFAKFARPGYIRVNATANPTSGVYVTAYKSGDTLVIVAVNQNSSSREVTFSLSGDYVSSYTKYETSSSNSLSNMGYVGSTNTLAAYSINTFVGTIISGIPGDLNEDLKVDFIDFAIFSQGWQTTYNIYTLADIADNWLYGA